MRKIIGASVLAALLATSVQAGELTIQVTPEMVAPCTEDAPDGCYLLTIPLPLALQGVRIDRASLTLDVVPGAESGIADTGFGIIRVGLPADLTTDGTGADRANVKSVPIRAEGRSRITIDILRYVRKVQDAEDSTLRLVIGVPDLDDMVTARPDATTLSAGISYIGQQEQVDG